MLPLHLQSGPYCFEQLSPERCRPPPVPSPIHLSDNRSLPRQTRLALAHMASRHLQFSLSISHYSMG